MHDWTNPIRRRLQGLQLSAAREREIVDELSQHLQDRYEELRAGGATDEAARREAWSELEAPDFLAPAPHRNGAADEPRAGNRGSRRIVLRRDVVAGPPLRGARPSKEPDVHARLDVDAGARHRRDDRDLQRRRRRDAAAAAVSRTPIASCGFGRAICRADGLNSRCRSRTSSISARAIRPSNEWPRPAARR